MLICVAIYVRYEQNNKTIEAVIPGLRHSNVWELSFVQKICIDQEKLFL